MKEDYIDMNNKPLKPGFYIEIIKGVSHYPSEELCLVYPDGDRFEAFYQTGKTKILHPNWEPQKNDTTGSRNLKLFDVNKGLQEATDLIKFISEGLERVLQTTQSSIIPNKKAS